MEATEANRESQSRETTALVQVGGRGQPIQQASPSEALRASASNSEHNPSEQGSDRGADAIMERTDDEIGDNDNDIAHENQTFISHNQNSSSTTVHGEADPEAAAAGDTIAPSSPPMLSVTDKLGTFGLLFFSVGPILTLAALGFFSFLWFGNTSNGFWQAIMVQNWLTKSVAICSETIKLAVNFELGVIVAMTAAIALECSTVLLPDVASLSVMRATASIGSVWPLLWQQLTGAVVARATKTLRLLLLTLLAAIVYSLTQFASVFLLSDVSPAWLPGPAVTEILLIGTQNSYNGTRFDGNLVLEPNAWASKAAFYPTFAEYSEPPYVAEGVRDTGVTLRAFLPFANAQDRQTLLQYSGPTTVVDTRVSCQAPTITRPVASMPSDYWVLLEGSVATSQYTPRLYSFTYQSSPGANDLTNVSIPFSCLIDVWALTGSGSLFGQWPISICQLPEGAGGIVQAYSGGLVSEFQDPSSWYNESDPFLFYELNTIGAAYLVLNATAGSAAVWEDAFNENQSGFDAVLGADVFKPTGSAEREEWLDLNFGNETALLSISLCYTAFSQADLPVELVSVSNRTETSPTFDFTNGKFEFPALRKQMGQYGGSAEDRGILGIKSQSWFGHDEQYFPGSSAPSLQKYVNLAGDDNKPGNPGNISALLFVAGEVASLNGTKGSAMSSSLMHIWLFQEILATGGSVAFALQTMITLPSSMGYYDALPQFDDVAAVQRSFAVIANVPLTYRGFVVVSATVAVQLCMTMLVLLWFLKQTKSSRVGAAWAAVAQCSEGDTAEYVERAGVMSDRSITRLMKHDGMHRSLAGIRYRQGKVGVGTNMGKES